MADTDPALVIKDHKGAVHRVAGLSGWRIMEIIRDRDIPIRAECGGSGTCATCHVYVAQKWHHKIPAPDLDEQHILDTITGYKPGFSRLSCQILMVDDLDGLEVALAPGSEQS